MKEPLYVPFLKYIESITLYEVQSEMVKERDFRKNIKQQEDIYNEIDHEMKEYQINGNLGIISNHDFQSCFQQRFSTAKIV